MLLRLPGCIAVLGQENWKFPSELDKRPQTLLPGPEGAFSGVCPRFLEATDWKLASETDKPPQGLIAECLRALFQFRP